MILKDGETGHVWCQETGRRTLLMDGTFQEGTSVCCIGSRCMAWTAAVVKAAKEIKDTTPSAHKAAKHVNENRAKYGLPTEPTHGYCGKAGVPQHTKVVKA